MPERKPDKKQLPPDLLQQRILDAVNSSIVVTDPNLPDNPIVYVNPAFEHTTGYSSEEVIGSNCRFLQGCDRDQQVVDELRQALGEGREFQGVLRNYRKNGELFYNELSISPVRDGEGHLTHFIGVQQDVTDRVWSEQELSRTSSKLFTIFESITDAFFALDRQWRFTYLNSEAERVLLRKREELLGQNVWEEFPEAVGLSFYQQYHRAMDEGVTVEFEDYYPPLQTWVEVKAYPSETGISVYFRDINDRKQAEAERRESEERLRSVLVGYSSDIITILDSEGYVTYESPAVGQVLGKSPEDHIGRRGSDIIHPDDIERVSDAFAVLMEGGGVSPAVEYRLQHADGSWRYFEGIANNLLDEVGIEGVVVNSRDITERKQREKHVEELLEKLLSAQEEERRRMAYEIHDELTQMASAAHRRLQAFARRHPPATEGESRELEVIRELVHETVSVSRRIVADFRPMALDNLGLAAAVRRYVEGLRREGREVVYEEDLGERRLPHSVEITLFRVAQEALANVSKHVPAQSPARVELRLEKGAVSVLVADQGEGFDPSRQADSGPGERVGISGMRERVSLAGGSFKLESYPGEGTRLSARVPLPPDGSRSNE